MNSLFNFAFRELTPFQGLLGQTSRLTTLRGQWDLFLGLGGFTAGSMLGLNLRNGECVQGVGRRASARGNTGKESWFGNTVEARLLMDLCFSSSSFDNFVLSTSRFFKSWSCSSFCLALSKSSSTFKL